MTPMDIDRSFFTAIVKGDVAYLSTLLSDDFVLNDVMQGDAVPRAGFLEAIKGGDLIFTSVDIEPGSINETRRPGISIISGCTQMKGSFQGMSIEAASRYMHVYEEVKGGWKLWAAQGTRRNVL